jgi:hypothetical protein
MSQAALFLIGLLLLVGLILAVTILARAFRSKLIWTPLGRTLVSIGFANANGTIDDLKPGQRYIVTQSFADLETGQTLTYRGQQYIDHVGHVLEFEERTLTLHEEKDAAVLRKIWAYLKPQKVYLSDTMARGR